VHTCRPTAINIHESNAVRQHVQLHDVARYCVCHLTCSRQRSDSLRGSAPIHYAYHSIPVSANVYSHKYSTNSVARSTTASLNAYTVVWKTAFDVIDSIDHATPLQHISPHRRLLFAINQAADRTFVVAVCNCIGVACVDSHTILYTILRLRCGLLYTSASQVYWRLA